MVVGYQVNLPNLDRTLDPRSPVHSPRTDMSHVFIMYSSKIQSKEYIAETISNIWRWCEIVREHRDATIAGLNVAGRLVVRFLN